MKMNNTVNNGEKIRRMSSDELAELFSMKRVKCCFCAYDTCDDDADCQRGILEWLNSDVKQNDER